MSWRPKDWKNRYDDPHWNDDGETSGMEACVYEEGANAMLESICKNGYVTSEALRNVNGGRYLHNYKPAPGWEHLKDGKWYYIPDEEVE